MSRIVNLPLYGTITTRKLREIMRNVLGETEHEDLSRPQALEMWDILKSKTPKKTSSSLHITECQYAHRGVTYSVLWEHGSSSELPLSVSVIKKRNWSEHAPKLR